MQYLVNIRRWLRNRLVSAFCWRNEDLTATLISVVFHLFLVLFLAIMVLRGPIVGKNKMAFFSAASSSDARFEVEALETADSAIEDGSEEPVAITEIEMLPTSIESIKLHAELKQPETMVIEPVAKKESQPSPSKTLAANLDKSRPRTEKSRPIEGFRANLSKKGTSVTEPLLTQPKDGVLVENSAQDAAGKILSQLEGVGDGDHDGPVRFIWLMDASLSLLSERKTLAPVVHTFYEKLVAKNQERNLKLTSDVYAFGKNLVPVVHDDRDPSPKAIAGAIEKLPIDETGMENVMSALSKALYQIPAHLRNLRIEVVIWTDESGDDLDLLEDVIQQCRYRQARVHVVGPLSVFGMRQGLQQYVIGPPYNIPMMLPVNRGPDSAFVERARLPIWDSTSNFGWGSGNFMPATLNGASFGGPHRERLLASTGPYALTRLALATGGTFTALERAGDAAVFDRSRLKDYLPDYRSGAAIAMDIDMYPIRRAIIESAALMGDIEYWPPRFEFPSVGNKEFPYAHYVPYMEPARALSTLDNDLAEDINNLQPAQRAIEQAIQMLLMAGMPGSVGSPGQVKASDSKTGIVVGGIQTAEAYDAERSPRWRAWYELNLGRLLAHSVRINEYKIIRQRFELPEIKQEILNKGVNHFILVPSKLLHGGTDSETRAAMAKKLLERVIRDHPNTPWSQLAEWELERPFGIDCTYSFISPPPPPQPVIFTGGPQLPSQSAPRSSGRSFPPPTIPRL
jgi:hypothetical protein